MPAPAGHVLYGGGPADFVGAGTDGQPLTITGGVEITVYDDGTPLTDLYDASGNGPTTTITSDSFGTFEFYAPGGLGTLDVSTDGGVSLYPVQPARLGSDVETVRATADQALAQTGGTGIPNSQKAQANGVATLDANAQLVQQVPNMSRVVGLTSALAAKVDTTDTRLANARTPTVHASSHELGGADELLLALEQVNGLLAELASKAPVTHRYYDAVTDTWTPRPTGLPANVPAEAFSTHAVAVTAPPGAVLGDTWTPHPDQP